MKAVDSLRVKAARALGPLDRVVERVLAWDERTLERISTSVYLRPFSFPLLVATYVGYGYVWAALALALIIFGNKKDHENVLIGLGVAIVVLSVCQLAKAFTARPRPVFARHGFHHRFLTTSSFPSIHATVAFAFAYLVAQLYPAWYNIAFLYLLAFLIALSRVYLREHYPLDVLGGAALGTWLAYGLLPWFARCVG